MRSFSSSFRAVESEQSDTFLNKTQWFLPPFLCLSFFWQNTPTGIGKWLLCWARGQSQTLLFSTTHAVLSPSLCSHRNECILDSCKVNGPLQTKEIKFGNLAVTGVLWVRSDHTEGRYWSPTRCSICPPEGFSLVKQNLNLNYFLIIIMSWLCWFLEENVLSAALRAN